MNYEKMNVIELKKICKEMSIPTAGKKKNEMIVAIKEKDVLNDKQNIGLDACDPKEEILGGDDKIYGSDIGTDKFSNLIQKPTKSDIKVNENTRKSSENDIGTDEFSNIIQSSSKPDIKVNESAKRIDASDIGTDEFSNLIQKSSKPDIKVNENTKKIDENDIGPHNYSTLLQESIKPGIKMNESAKKINDNTNFFDKNIVQDFIISNDENDEIIIEKTNVVIHEKYIEEDIITKEKNANKLIKAPIEDNPNKINVKYTDTNESEETIKKMEKQDLKERGLEVKEAAIESEIDLHKQIYKVKTPDDIAQTIAKEKEEEENSLRDKKVLEDEIKEFDANENSTEEGEIKKRKFNGYNIIIKDVHDKLTEIAQMNEDERIKARKKRFGNFEKK
ncbi:hypothetical protein COBT_002443 [Conglomerata obtusa]